MVALTGAAAGLALAWGVLRLVLTGGWAGAGDALPRLDAIGLHAPVLGFTLAVSVLTALLFGVLPGLGLVRRAPSRPLHGADRGSADRGRRRAWRALVAAEVALAVVLLAGSGLLLRSLWEVLRQDPGFDPGRVTAVSVHLPASLYPGNPEKRGYFDELLERLEARPEVAGAGLVSSLPLGGSGSNGLIQIEGGAVPDLTAEYRVAGGEYFEALAIPLLEGRRFDRRDHPDAPHAALVDRALAEAAWPGESPIGKRLTGGGMDDYWDQDVWATVVGVVGDVRQDDLTEAGGPTVYFHHRQRPFRLWAGALAAGRLVASLLYGVEPADPATLAAVAALLAAAAFNATYLPARATVRIDPVETLKAE